MRKIVSNKFYVTTIADNYSLSVVLYTQNSLSQVYNPESGYCIPNWETDVNSRPTVYCIARVNGTIQEVYDIVWKYNSSTLTFDGNNESAAVQGADAKTFKKTTKEIEQGKPAQPALLVKKNLAGSGNQDHDVISLSGSVEVGGTLIPFTVNQPVRITTQSSSGYYGFITGDSVITSDNPSERGYTASMSANLYNGSSPVKTFNTKWYIEGESSFFAVVETEDYEALCDVTGAMVLDNAIIRVDYYEGLIEDGGPFVYSAFWSVDDLRDPEQLQIAHGLANQNNQALKKGEKVGFYVWMGRTDNPEYVDETFNKFEVKITGSDNKAVPIAVDKSNDYTISKTTGTADYVDITVTGEVTLPTSVKTSKAGKATITYDFGESLGGLVTGYVTASGTSE